MVMYTIRIFFLPWQFYSDIAACSELAADSLVTINAVTVISYFLSDL